MSAQVVSCQPAGAQDADYNQDMSTSIDMRRQQPTALSFSSPATYVDTALNRSKGIALKQQHGVSGASVRRKVVAMACQPCRGRKTKCDGQKPVCSACVHRGIKTCFYDLSSDMRRTSALKKRIDHLLEDITNLRDIILVLTRSYNIPHDRMIVQKIEQTLYHGKWSYLPELARVLEDHISTTRPIAQPPIQLESGGTHPVNTLAAQPPSMLRFSGTQPTTADGSVQVCPATMVPSSWMQVGVPPVPSVYVDNLQANSFYIGAAPSTN